MIALDTNVFVALESGSAETVERTLRTISRVGKDGPVVVSGPVFAELCAGSRAPAELAARLRAAQIGIETDLSAHVWYGAGIAYSEYIARRRKIAGGEARRILADFIIGAHAGEIGTLVTGDAAFFRRSFPQLHVVDPREEALD